MYVLIIYEHESEVEDTFESLPDVLEDFHHVYKIFSSLSKNV